MIKLSKEVKSTLLLCLQGFGINGAKIISANHLSHNGVVHVIDKILFPPEGSAMDRVQENPELR